MTLYGELMQLCDNDDSFFFVDQIFETKTYRIFNYRLASYTQWLNPGALDARGITFLLNGGNTPVCVSRPFEKFFNLNENPMTMDLDLSTTVEILDKVDGSLISSVSIPTSGFILKSKGSLFSDQAQASNFLIRTTEYIPLCEYIAGCAAYAITVIMEYVAPDNRIVIGYEEPQLIVLGVRDNHTGKYVDLIEVGKMSPRLQPFIVGNIKVDNIQSWVDAVPAMDKVEGYVIRLESSQRVKIKTDWYLALHRLKDSVNSQRRLFEACVYETADDVRAAYYDDPVVIQTITEMEVKVKDIYNHMVNLVEKFYNDNKGLERKEYAIKGQKDLGKMYFGLAMNLYLGKDVDYKVFMIKHRMDYGIKDDPKPIPTDLKE